MPISEKAKSALAAFDGKPVRIDAQEVYQPMNPGDGLITKLQVLGIPPEPSGPEAWRYPVLDDLTLTVVPDFSSRNQVTLELKNNGSTTREIRMDALGPTVLGKKEIGAFGNWGEVADGPSHAVVTRCSLANSCSGNAAKVIFPPGKALPKSIGPKESVQVPVLIELPAGEYQFLVGYGGGVHDVRSLVSNRISFDVDDTGRAHLTSP